MKRPNSCIISLSITGHTDSDQSNLGQGELKVNPKVVELVKKAALITHCYPRRGRWSFLLARRRTVAMTASCISPIFSANCSSQRRTSSFN